MTDLVPPWRSGSGNTRVHILLQGAFRVDPSLLVCLFPIVQLPIPVHLGVDTASGKANFATKSKVMAGPIELDNPGQETKFPSWPAGTHTKLWVRNKSATEESVVTIQAGAAAGEDLKTAAGQRACYERDFGGLEFRVINSNGVEVQVWTV